MANYKHQFCPKGHDTFKCGRYRRQCIQCRLEKQRIDPTVDARIKQFCKYGHDTFICGRYGDGTCKECKNVYTNVQRQTNVLFNIKFKLRDRMRKAIQNNYKSGSAVQDLGCSISEFKQYIEKKFYDGMTWGNWGTVWELDHIIPLWKFDLTDRNQLLNAVHHTNMQPLTIEDHQKKSIKDRKEFSEFKANSNV